MLTRIELCFCGKNNGGLGSVHKLVIESVQALFGKKSLQFAMIKVDGGDNQLFGKTVGETMPCVVFAEKMTRAEKMAFERGIWDGLERRDFLTSKQESTYKRNQRRRLRDKQNMTLYYALLAVLWLVFLVWLLAGLFFNSGSI